MEIEQKTRLEVLTQQKTDTLKAIIGHELHRDFHKQRFAQMKPKTKEEKETIAHQKLQTINPLEDNIAIKTAYYEWLCAQE